MRMGIPDRCALGRLLLLCAAPCLLSFALLGHRAFAAPPSIVVGSETDFPPYALVDGAGNATGYSIDLIRSVAREMGLDVTVRTGSWNWAWNALKAGEVDVLSIVARIPGREREVDFSIIHTSAHDSFFTRRGTPPIASVAQAEGREVVVMRADAAHHALVSQGFKGTIIAVDTIPEGLRLVASGRHDAFLCPKLIGLLVLEEQDITGLEPGPPIPDYRRDFSFAVKKGNQELLERLNQGLLIVKTRGEYEKIHAKWLGFGDPWLVKHGRPIAMGAGLLGLLAVLVAAWSMLLRRQVRARTAELTELSAHLQSVSETEKARLAREIHDELGGTLAALRLTLGQLRGTPGPDRDEYLDRADGLLARAAETQKWIVSRLRPAVLDHLGLAAAIEWQVEEFRKHTGMEVDLRLPQEKLLMDEARAIALFRILQECLTNVIKHAAASRVAIEIGIRDARVHLTVRDDGRGMPPRQARQARSFGIIGMAERARHLGGELCVSPAAGGGTVVEAVLPAQA